MSDGLPAFLMRENGYPFCKSVAISFWEQGEGLSLGEDTWRAPPSLLICGGALLRRGMPLVGTDAEGAPLKVSVALPLTSVSLSVVNPARLSLESP